MIAPKQTSLESNKNYNFSDQKVFDQTKVILGNMDHWLGDMVDHLDNFSDSQKKEIFYDIKQIKLHLHLFERLILVKDPNLED